MSRVSEVDSFQSNVIALAAWPVQTFARCGRLARLQEDVPRNIAGGPRCDRSAARVGPLDIRPLNGVAWSRRAAPLGSSRFLLW
jgi:hypothetical protein